MQKLDKDDRSNRLKCFLMSLNENRQSERDGQEEDSIRTSLLQKRVGVFPSLNKKQSRILSRNASKETE